MASSSRRVPVPQHPTPFFPGAWPNSSKETNDADVSTASYPAMSGLRETSVTADKAYKRWTYAGPGTESQTPLLSPATPTSPEFLTLTTSTSQDSRMSQFTENTLSSAASSALNTPDLARWPTLPSAGNDSQLAITPCANGAPEKPRDFFTQMSEAPAPLDRTSPPTGSRTCSPSMLDRFPSPYLDPPLLNIVASLPPLQLPLSPEYRHQDSPPAPPSPLSESCSTPASLTIPSLRREYPLSALRSTSVLSPSCIATDFFPVVEVTPEPSPQLTIASLPSSSHISDAEADSLVLPPSERSDTRFGGTSRPSFMHSSPSASQMDAFALAAAVAVPASRSSLSIPPSFQSAYGSSVPPDELEASDIPRPPARRQQSCLTQASAGHWSRETRTPGDAPGIECDARAPDFGGAEDLDRKRVRRRSAPMPIVRRSARAAPSKVISSRVDVGERATPRKVKSGKQPVLGKVRRLGERLRGLFKSKGDSPLKARTRDPNAVPEFGLMTTTTAVTNVEYESEHPIPIPSPRAKILRNHRRSLPLPSLLLPPSADNLAAAIFKRPTASRSNTSEVPSTDRLSRDDESSVRTPTHSPRTPRPRRQRIHTAPQGSGNEENTQDDGKARRFSLSSALSKSRLDTLRSTVMPRPPLPPMPSRTSHHDSNLAALPTSGSYYQPRSIDGDSPSLSVENTYWGGILPSVHITRDSQDRRSTDESPRRVRTQTAPPGPHNSPVPDTVTTTPKAKRPRRFSLTSMMARRASRSRVAIGGPNGSSIPPSPSIPDRTFPVPRIRRPRGDTVTTITQGVSFDIIQPKPALEVNPPPSIPQGSRSRISMASSVSSFHAGSAYFDAREQFSEENHHSSSDADRSYSPRPESDLDSMSFARTPDYSSGTFSFWSNGERDRYLDADDLSIPGSYNFRPSVVGRCASTSAVSQLVGESTSTPITKTLRFSPSLSLSFERSWSDDADDDEVARLEQEEDRGFMRALGFEFDQIARRVREEPY